VVGRAGIPRRNFGDGPTPRTPDWLGPHIASGGHIRCRGRRQHQLMADGRIPPPAGRDRPHARRQHVLRGCGLVIPLHHTSISNQRPFPSAPESARRFPKVLEMQRAKRCPDSPSLCWTHDGDLGRTGRLRGGALYGEVLAAGGHPGGGLPRHCSPVRSFKEDEGRYVVSGTSFHQEVSMATAPTGSVR
jgi:hypothetical protein